MQTSPNHKPSPMIDMLVSIILPTIVLMKFSGEDHLGPAGGLVVALAFPLIWGLYELIKYKKFNFIALLGLVSVILTGGIGLLELDNKWLAIKEAGIPALIGLGVFISAFTRYPLVRSLLLNPEVLNIDKINRRLEEENSTAIFESRLRNATFFVAASFVFSSVMNYILVKWLVTSPAGTEAFNEELGVLTLYSYGMIAVPSMLMMMAIFYYLWRTIKGLTGLELEDIMSEKLVEK